MQSAFSCHNVCLMLLFSSLFYGGHGIRAENVSNESLLTESIEYLRGAGFDIGSLTNDYSAQSDKGWLAISTPYAASKDAGLKTFVSVNGLVEVYFSRYPGWSYSLGRSVSSNDVHEISASILERMGLDTNMIKSDVVSAVRIVFFPKAHATSKPILFLYASSDFGIIERRQQGGASNQSYAW